MDLNEMIKTLKAYPEHERIGMIASHLGVVRGVSRTGEAVTGIEVMYDQNKIKDIVIDIKRLQGIIDVLVDTNEGFLNVGDEIMAVAVAGDIRENVFPALIKTVDRLKKEAARKKEWISSKKS